MSDQKELQALGEVARRVVHDTNNALAPVLGFAELLLEDDDLLADTEKVKQYLTLIRDGANEAIGIVTALRACYADNGNGGY